MCGVSRRKWRTIVHEFFPKAARIPLRGPVSSSFSDPDAVARYRDGPPRQVPGFADLHRMTDLLVAERTPDDGRELVLGAGGGLELEQLAGAHAGWVFDGIDPSAEMLGLAAATTEPFAGRIRLHEGYVDGAPEGPFDAAVACSRCTSSRRPSGSTRSASCIAG